MGGKASLKVVNLETKSETKNKAKREEMHAKVQLLLLECEIVLLVRCL